MARDQVAFIMFFSAVEKEIQSGNNNTLRTITLPPPPSVLQ